jgi:hypothetical protein
MGLFWAAPYFLAAVAVHALLVRTRLTGNSVAKFLAAGGLLGLLLGGHVLAYDGLGLGLSAALAAYAFACELYIFLFTMVMSSVSVKLLLSLRERDLLGPEIDVLYDSAGMVARRLDRLVAVGLLQPDGTFYRVSPRGRRLGWTFAALRHFFRHCSETPSRPGRDDAA